MDSEVDEGLGPRPGTERTGDSTEATKPSPDSSEPSSGRRGSKRLVRAAVSAPGSGDSQPGARVLRAPGSGDPQPGVRVLRAPGSGDSQPGVRVLRAPGSGDPQPGVRVLRAPGSGDSQPGVRVLRAPGSGDSQPGVRVLRARGAEASRTNVNESKRKTTVVHRGRGRPAGPRPNKNPPATQPKKSTAKKASRHTPGPKLSKSRKGKGRPPTQVSRIPPATACKPEAEMEASVCGEEERGSFKGSDDSVADPDAALDEDPSFGDDLSDLIYNPEAKTEKSRRRRTVKQKEVKKEESENEEEEDDIKKEETTEVVVQSEAGVGNNTEPPRKRGRQQKDDKVPRPPKQRKKPPVQYVRCEIEGCGTVLAHPRYLQHHIKYQHLLKKKYVCDHPSCGRLFRLQKQLLRHAKHHTDQRDYICEFCARAFKSSHNLAVHRMIHTGEKPIQCEICGFTCRQKASLNWHMKKHDAGASYQFSCSICSKKFEKKDSVVAHKAKSHPEVLIAEALAANGGSVISSPITIPEAVPVLTPTPETVPVLTPTPETVPVLARSDRPPVSQGNHDVVTSTLTPLQQVVLPLAPQTPLDGSQGQFLHLPAQHVVQVAPQQQVPALLHLTTASPAHLSSISHPQLIHLSTVPTSTVADPQSTLLTLSSVSPLASTASLASQQALQWGRGTHEDTQLPGEGELWDRVVVGGGHQDVEEMMWEENEERRKEDGGVVWERERGRQIILQCAEVHEDGLI